MKAFAIEFFPILSKNLSEVIVEFRSENQMTFLTHHTCQKFKNTGQYKFPILVLNDDNMLGEYKGREKKYCLRKAFLENPHFVLWWTQILDLTDTGSCQKYFY